MKSKAPLTLMEQAIMLLVFALAAVLCLQAFVWADAASQDITDRDQALIQAQSAAEVLKSCGGNMKEAARIYGGTWDGQVWVIRYDGQWQQTEGKEAYLLTAVLKEPNMLYLGAADVSVACDEVQLAQLDVAWQEVGGHG